MILSDRELLARGPALLDPFVAAHVNPASIDICVGDTVIEEGGAPADLRAYRASAPYWLQPGAFVLVSTRECFTVPVDLVMDLRLKSSRAREGYSHLLAFWFDPGWHGVGTLELVNVNQRTALPLYPGLRIGQVIYHRLSEPPHHPYCGRYQHAAQVEASKGDTTCST